ncbi:iron complex transport system ATP-binding protein [Geomicrobium halophilum]|uniref:Iron complex transport system ATP-binding protein n=1 Tax=Geomicrobium halophilum TaxID=549000 RepID=A0A841PZZ8_9BACL|nr:ABC transporter ATP-binding protein [Geomicrobium halophilum]MBB6450285.1 iron complex transport system ATP-binding protein [Geomicrobium halophilum]
MTRLEANHLSIRYEKEAIVDDLTLQIPEGKITTIIGPNGCGKSTILKTLGRVMNASQGSVYLDGKSIHTQPTKQIAQKMAILPQGPEAPSGLKVRELVAYGRHPHQRGFAALHKQDYEMIDLALEQTGMAELGDRSLDALSGGQRQRVWIAMALAQQTELLLLDEPTTYLDLAHQLEVLQVLQRLNEQQGRTIVLVIHDLNHASRFADHMVALREGAIVREGRPEDVMNTQVLRDVFQIEADVVADPRSGKPVCLSYDLMMDGDAQPSQKAFSLGGMHGA